MKDVVDENFWWQVNQNQLKFKIIILSSVGLFGKSLLFSPPVYSLPQSCSFVNLLPLVPESRNNCLNSSHLPQQRRVPPLRIIKSQE